MANQAPETVSKYEVLFALRTGVTILIPKTAALDPGVPASFNPSGQDLQITAAKPLILKNLKKEHLEAAVSRGFVMIYETEDDEVVRNTLVNYMKTK